MQTTSSEAIRPTLPNIINRYSRTRVWQSISVS